ncbi:GrpB family protein [Macrococcus lamae]|uniref:GrpB family protein n=1 Tax=Macrococcus lamae TaxID=198484 RepID=A0A4R6BWM7_9STAP|nr:GrpB family protein [Macrococcus lamae]TDM12621.1 GrpB family protein [Macrococcus lamae]
MIKQRPVITVNYQLEQYKTLYLEIEELLFNLLDTPVSAVHHIGGTAIHNAMTSPIIDVLVIVPNLHAMTTLDEKRLNNSGFYRLHHPYKKKCVFSQFTDFKSLDEQCRLHIVEAESEKSERYLTAQRLLSEDAVLLSQFNDFKVQLASLSKKDYEEQKSIWFSSLIAK